MSDQIRNGACRYCGQIMNTDVLNCQSEEEADSYATKHCSCNDAQRLRERESMKEQMEREREATLIEINSEIDELCGEELAEYGLKPIRDEIKDMIKQAAELIYDKKMKNITFGVSSRTKVTITKSAKEKMQITRSDGTALRKEI